MRVLVTGAGGFIGKNVCAALDSIARGYDRRERVLPLVPLEVLRAGSDTSDDELAGLCAEADFVVHLAGANRPDDESEFALVNEGVTRLVVEALEAAANDCPVLLASSVQASEADPRSAGPYGRSKRAAEALLEGHASRTGAKALVYRLPNVFGKWSRPDYNSVVATFCHRVARGLPIRVDDESAALDLLYVDDFVEEVIGALLGEEHGVGGVFCEAGPTHRTTVGELATTIRGFSTGLGKVEVADEPAGSLAKCLHATYLSFVPGDDLFGDVLAHADERGSFAELVRTDGAGQVSVVRVAPGKTRGNHWHHTKWERFVVVAGRCEVSMAPAVGAGEVRRVTLSADEPRWAIVPPGCAHALRNPSAEQEAVVVIWASECFDPGRPDTYFKEVTE